MARTSRPRRQYENITLACRKYIQRLHMFYKQVFYSTDSISIALPNESKIGVSGCEETARRVCLSEAEDEIDGARRQMKSETHT